MFTSIEDRVKRGCSRRSSCCVDERVCRVVVRSQKVDRESARVFRRKAQGAVDNNTVCQFCRQKRDAKAFVDVEGSGVEPRLRQPWWGGSFAVPPARSAHLLASLGEDLYRVHQHLHCLQPNSALTRRTCELFFVYIEQCIVSDHSAMSGNPFRTSAAPNHTTTAPPPISSSSIRDGDGGSWARVERESDAGICSRSHTRSKDWQ